jgi:hypothetical protein
VFKVIAPGEAVLLAPAGVVAPHRLLPRFAFLLGVHLARAASTASPGAVGPPRLRLSPAPIGSSINTASYYKRMSARTCSHDCAESFTVYTVLSEIGEDRGK